MWDAIKRFFKWLWKLLKKLFGGKKGKKTVLKITVLLFLLVSFSFAQRTQLDYVTAEYDQEITPTTPIQLWVINWTNGDSMYSDAVEYDSTLLPEQWPDTNLVVTTQDSINFHIKYKLAKPFQYKTEYSFSVTAMNDKGYATSDVVYVLFFKCDFNDDKNVDGLDLIELVKPSNWGKTNAGYRDFIDVNRDSNVDGLDLIELVKPENWGSSWTPPN